MVALEQVLAVLQDGGLGDGSAAMGARTVSCR
jgi:hypothetical protein